MSPLISFAAISDPLHGISQAYCLVRSAPTVEMIVSRISYLEIYNETMIDLLASLPESAGQEQINPMTVVEDQNGVYVKGLSCHLAQSEEEALNLLFEVRVTWRRVESTVIHVCQTGFCAVCT